MTREWDSESFSSILFKSKSLGIKVHWETKVLITIITFKNSNSPHPRLQTANFSTFSKFPDFCWQHQHDRQCLSAWWMPLAPWLQSEQPRTKDASTPVTSAAHSSSSKLHTALHSSHPCPKPRKEARSSRRSPLRPRTSRAASATWQDGGQARAAWHFRALISEKQERSGSSHSPEARTTQE